MHIHRVESTGSTNEDLLASDLLAGSVLIADEQTSARGRAGRSWSSPKGAQLSLSYLTLTPVRDDLGWLPLMVGLALSDVIPGSSLKWPNDLLLGEKKLAGILVEACSLADGTLKMAIGVGLNHLQTREQLPVENATSLHLEGIELSREELTEVVLAAMQKRIAQWQEGKIDRATYEQRCTSLGRNVRVHTGVGAQIVEGYAEGIDEAGRIVVAGRAFDVGDIEHLRHS